MLLIQAITCPPAPPRQQPAGVCFHIAMASILMCAFTRVVDLTQPEFLHATFHTHTYIQLCLAVNRPVVYKTNCLTSAHQQTTTQIAGPPGG